MNIYTLPSSADVRLQTTFYPDGDSQMYNGGTNDDDSALKSDKDEDIAEATNFAGEDLGLRKKSDERQEGPTASQLQ